LDIIPLPYVKVFTNKKGHIEAQCNLNSAPTELCELLASFLTSHEDIPEQKLRLISSNESENFTEVQAEEAEYEKALELYSSPINAEFRLTKDFEGRLNCKGSNVPDSEVIRSAILRKSVEAIDEAINCPSYIKK
jgi:hypothetical protein